MNQNRSIAGFLWAASAAVVSVRAQTCVKPADSDWQIDTVVSAASTIKLDKPVNMSILPDGRVFFCEMWSGKIKLYTPGAGVSEAGSVTVYADGVENGLLGIAADPAFATNHWVYVFYSRKLAGATFYAGDNNVSPHEHVLARLTFTDGKLGNPKDILTFRRQSKRHAAGGITFNPATGDLYVPTGDDVFPGRDSTYWGGRSETFRYFSDLSTAANTNDLRGKVLRIRPIPFSNDATPVPGVGTTYTIPEGNLFPPGKYPADKTRPEIYTMGHRNPYKIRIDPVSGVGLIGEVGPDAPGPDPERGPTGSDEFNLVAGPGNYGWPFAIADNQPYVAYNGEAYPKGTTFDPAHLKNKSAFNSGIEDLPPAIGALAYYNALNSQTGPNTVFGSGGESAMSGPYYRYDASKPAQRLPAYFHGKFIVGDWTRGKIWTLELNPDRTLKKVELLRNAAKVIDLAISPDGDLYILLLSTGGGYEGDANTGTLLKMKYKGAQYAASACSQYVLPAGVVGLASARAAAPGTGRNGIVELSAGSSLRAPAGSVHGVVYDLQGERLWEGAVRDGRLTLPAGLGARFGFLRFR